MEALANEIVSLSRASLVLHLRFMESALLRLAPVASTKGSISVDGSTYSYAPKHVLARYRKDSGTAARDYLHCVLHCLFRHMYVPTIKEKNYWNLACDIMVEDLITSLGVSSTVIAAETEQQQVVGMLRREVKPFTAEKLYRYFVNDPPEDSEWRRLKLLFMADDHKAWYPREDGDGSDGKERSEDSPDAPAPRDPPMENEQSWREAAESIEEDLKTFSREAGDIAGELRKALGSVNRERYDYADFLRRFAVRGEIMKADPSEFDYIYYTYGLKLYGNMPLIESLEYREDKRIRSFVIAIDTSGSITDRMVKSFLQKTYNILKQEDSFFGRTDIRIIQCDSKIQGEAVIHNENELEVFIRDLTLGGFGGTDFRPVFERVDELIRSGELSRLKGLIYFTDGDGVYPEKMPAYDTAFIFIENEDNRYDVPVWASKLVLDQDMNQ
jgi:predicted metal-dependent peptidase